MRFEVRTAVRRDEALQVRRENKMQPSEYSERLHFIFPVAGKQLQTSNLKLFIFLLFRSQRKPQTLTFAANFQIPHINSLFYGQCW
jgi:hypothetical protein